jgi:F-type H+-transporting ATPase subunit delta
VFHGNRWAAAFVAALGENAGAGFDCLKAMSQPLKAVSGTLFGYSAARRLEAMLRDAVDVQNEEKNLPRSFTEEEEKDIKTPCDSVSFVVKNSSEYAIRFICLLVEKNRFRYIDMIIHKIEEYLDAQKGILAVTVESASPLDSIFMEKLTQRIMERLGAAEVKMDTVLVPDLLGGYRLRIGGFYIDASVKGQMEQMKVDLAEGIQYGGL